MNDYSDESDMPPQVNFSTVAHNEYGARYVRLSYITFMGWAVLLTLAIIIASLYSGRLRGLGALILLFFVFDRAEKILKGRGISLGKIRSYHYFSAVFPFIPLLFIAFDSDEKNLIMFLLSYIGVTFPLFALSALSIYILRKFDDIDLLKSELKERNVMYENYREWLYR